MNEDEKLIAELDRMGSSMCNRAANRLRELTAVGTLVVNEPTRPCDAATALAHKLLPHCSGQGITREGVALIQSALTAKAEEVRERCAKHIDHEINGLGTEFAKAIRALDLTEAS